MNQKEIINIIRTLSIKKIVIVGFPGSGKSTLAKFIAHEIAIPHIEADTFFWINRNESLAPDQLVSLVEKELQDKNSWVFEGHFKTCQSVVLKDAALVIDIKNSFMKSFYNYFTREIKRKDENFLTKLKKICFVPLNYQKIIKTKEEALATYQGKIVRISF